MEFNTIEEAISDIKEGKAVVVVDDENRENEGDIVIAAEKATPELINFMIKYGRGLVCVPMEGKRLDELGINQMVTYNTDKKGTSFTVSVDAKEGTTTGISAHDRAKTIKALIDPDTKPNDLTRPGHIFPLRAIEGSVLRRAGHTEAAVELAKMAGLYPAGVICEIMNEDGTMARVPELMRFVKEHGLKIITIKDLIKESTKREKIVERVAEADLPTKYGDFRIYVYKTKVDDFEHVAIVKGNVSGEKDVLVRVHSECFTGDTLGSKRCECGDQLEEALKRIEREGRGVVLYLRQEGRGIGLVNKIKAYSLQDKGLDTVDANIALGFGPDMRDYGIGAQILKDLGLSSIKILTNNPTKLIALEGHGLRITGRESIQVGINDRNIGYLKTKKDRMGHIIDI